MENEGNLHFLYNDDSLPIHSGNVNCWCIYMLYSLPFNVQIYFSEYSFQIPWNKWNIIIVEFVTFILRKVKQLLKKMYFKIKNNNIKTEARIFLLLFPTTEETSVSSYWFRIQSFVGHSLVSSRKKFRLSLWTIQLLLSIVYGLFSSVWIRAFL